MKKDEMYFSEMVSRAEQEIMVGGRYRHNKSGGTYKIVGLAILEATEEVGVIYRAEYGEKLTWIRSFDDFTGEKDGKKRFTQIEEIETLEGVGNE